LVESEIDKVIKRYEHRTNIVSEGKYSMLNPAVWQTVQERQRKLINLFSKNIKKPLAELSLLEIGCGTGGNILELIRLGFSPNNIIGNELLPERTKLSRKNLPAECKIIEGDASTLPYKKHTFDIVYQSTVFTSLLDLEFQKKLAECMWEWVKPGGAVLWYDFIFNNPSNPDVKGVSLRRVKELFPDAIISFKRVTLAPPISRRVTKIHPSLYSTFNFFPFLRTHILCWISKAE